MMTCSPRVPQHDVGILTDAQYAVTACVGRYVGRKKPGKVASLAAVTAWGEGRTPFGGGVGICKKCFFSPNEAHSRFFPPPSPLQHIHSVTGSRPLCCKHITLRPHHDLTCQPACRGFS